MNGLYAAAAGVNIDAVTAGNESQGLVAALVAALALAVLVAALVLALAVLLVAASFGCEVGGGANSCSACRSSGCSPSGMTPACAALVRKLRLESERRRNGQE